MDNLRGEYTGCERRYRGDDWGGQMFDEKLSKAILARPSPAIPPVPLPYPLASVEVPAGVPLATVS